jgi:hypothetical protein
VDNSTRESERSGKAWSGGDEFLPGGIDSEIQPLERSRAEKLVVACLGKHDASIYLTERPPHLFQGIAFP